jgi:hypothetical protein
MFATLTKLWKSQEGGTAIEYGQPRIQRWADLDETVVVRRAKALAERDGFAWELNFRPMAMTTKIELQRLVSEERRKQYLVRARDELAKER